ncbi:hypothetical protein Y1Q_0000598 [Alligator mississippiensis]|uniref:Uncharacterized protein n=1 Tax=Alligator mississippiensis TaxID=8496 RepID=A0A151MBQ6_ALLMI|nr:hypothetical protein Y1Q_0000598 [Alligator mississippiensis]
MMIQKLCESQGKKKGDLFLAFKSVVIIELDTTGLKTCKDPPVLPGFLPMLAMRVLPCADGCSPTPLEYRFRSSFFASPPGANLAWPCSHVQPCQSPDGTSLGTSGFPVISIIPFFSPWPGCSTKHTN